MPASAPVSVSIPAIDVQSSLIELGLNADDTMEVPQDWDQTGWFKHSPTPGELGPAIVAGHVDSYRGPAVFYRLRDLEPGDTVEIIRDDGSVAVFSVTRTEQYPKDGFPTEKVYGNLDHAGLRLITCGGGFDSRTDHYRENLVVYAALVGAKS
jgi:sortase (surface protein transpeptidase)